MELFDVFVTLSLYPSRLLKPASNHRMGSAVVVLRVRSSVAAEEVTGISPNFQTLFVQVIDTGSSDRVQNTVTTRRPHVPCRAHGSPSTVFKSHVPEHQMRFLSFFRVPALCLMLVTVFLHQLAF